MLPEVPRDERLALRVCRHCGALGRVNSQGVVLGVSMLVRLSPKEYL